MEENEEVGIVTLLDEDGNEHPFEHIDSFEFNGEIYVCLVAADEGEESDEVLIFTLETDEDGKEALMLVEDEAELDMAFEEFKKRMQEEFDFE
ncbi:MAG: DUF1292 domain-containing protein [Clostridia bacterium]|nr:DUF1292 domain-containing protein [Clostridia bacterium]MBQ3554420.1 DUF1292 domain-containing protein [Clostridia bacterium]